MVNFNWSTAIHRQFGLYEVDVLYCIILLLIMHQDTDGGNTNKAMTDEILAMAQNGNGYSQHTGLLQVVMQMSIKSRVIVIYARIMTKQCLSGLPQ